MEEKSLHLNSLPAEETFATPPKKTFPWITVILLVIVAIISVATTVLFLKGTISPSPSPSSFVPTVTLTTQPITTRSDNTSLWKTYTNNEAGFSFKYPESVLLDAETKNAKQSVLLVSVVKLSSIPEDLPMSMGRNDALKEKDRLAKGEGENLSRIGSLNGQLATILSQFEVCSVLFTRKFTFYPGDYRVILTLAGPKGTIMTDMPDFFGQDPSNCGTERIWNQDKITEFESTLAQKKKPGSRTRMV